MIVDNLSSHFLVEILEQCQINNILFICLPPNATHLCQPLDVALFGPLKKKWRTILHDYKAKNPTASAVQKPKFPALLKRLLDGMSNNINSSMISGFKTCGTVPVNREVVKAKLQFNQIAETPENNEVIDFLRIQRGIPREEPSIDDAGPSTSSDVNNRTLKRKRSKSSQVTPGKPVTPETLTKMTPVSEKVRATALLKKKTSAATNTPTALNEASSIKSVKVGDAVIVKFEGRGRKMETNYAAIVLELDDDDVHVNFLRALNKGKDVFVLKDKDKSWERREDLCAKVPYTINNRGHYVFNTSLNVE